MPRLGRYELGKLLGVGGAGKVHEAELIGPGGFRKAVALKVLHKGGTALRREARIGGLLRHQNLVDVFEIGEVDGQWFCALELCEGSLSKHLPLPPRAVVEVGQQVCAALQYAHEALGLIHQDLKPDNVLLSADGVVKVADLGIARAEGFGHDGRIRGTPGYMPPEQAHGDSVDTRADVYALGVTLVELATGAIPGASGTLDLDSLDAPFRLDSGTLDLDSLDPAPPDVTVRQIDTVVPHWLAPAIDRCLAIDPSDRWPDMAALAVALGELQAQGPSLQEALGLDEPLSNQPPRSDSNLEEEPDLFVGRQQSLDHLKELLAQPGLVTLKGPAGIGKSRLATAAARDWRDENGGEAWFCDLSDVRSLDGLLYAVASALDIGLSGQDPVARIGHAVAGRGPLVVVLDNFEQIVELASVVDDWQRRAPDARLIVTSRVPLALPQERIVELEPLGEQAAVSLLVSRARMRGVELAGDPLLPQLAARVDGLPLALELAAGRLGVLSVREVLDRLGLGLLRAGADGRHGTLRAALEWSWELLTASEQTVLSQLSVFSGGFSVEAVEDVVEVQGSVLDILDSLVERSMVRAARDGRFDLLASVREFAAEHLDGAASEVRHAQHFAQMGKGEALEGLHDRGGHVRLHRLRQEIDNLVAASTRAASRGDAEVAAHTALAAWQVLAGTGPFHLGVTVLEAALATPGTDPRQRARLNSVLSRALQGCGRMEEAMHAQEKALVAARKAHDLRFEGRVLGKLGVLHRLRANMDEAQPLLERALELARTTGDRAHEGHVLGDLAVLHRIQGRIEDSRAAFDAAIAIHRELGSRRSEGNVLANVAILHHNQGRIDMALEYFEAALAIHRAVGNRRSEAVVVGNIGLVHSGEGRQQKTLEYYELALTLHRQVGDRGSQGVVLGNLGVLYNEMGQPDQARAHYDASLAIHREVDNRRYAANVLGNLAVLHDSQGRFDEARQTYQEALASHRETGNRRHEGIALANLAMLDLRTGSVEDARAQSDRAEALLHEIGDIVQLGTVFCGRARIHHAAGETSSAHEAVQEAQRLAEQSQQGPETDLGIKISAVLTLLGMPRAC